MAVCHLPQCPARPPFPSWHAPRQSPPLLVTELLLRLVRPGYDQTIVASTRLETSPETSPFATELLIRLLGAGSAQTIVTSLDSPPSVRLSDTLINDPGPTTARHAPASWNYGETRRTAQSSVGGFDGWRAHLSSDLPIDRVVQHEILNDGSGREPKVGRRKVLNDVCGRELKVFRKSPCPPRARNSAQD